MSAFADLIRGHVLGDGSVEGGFVQGPAVLATSGLHQGCQVGLRDMKATEPDDWWLTLIDLLNKNNLDLNTKCLQEPMSIQT